MPQDQPLFTGAFPGGPDDEFSRQGRRPVIFDILGPDNQTSILPEGLRMVLHVNPRNMSLKYTRQVERIQTRGGFVEQHWGDAANTIDIEAATGGFMRLYTGLSNVTSPAMTGGSRRETLAYDSYLDLLALFHNNGSVYDIDGQVALQGVIKMTFDQGVYLVWMDSFTATESTENPYQFTLSASMTVRSEVQVWKTSVRFPTVTETISQEPAVAQTTADARAAAAAQNTP